MSVLSLFRFHFEPSLQPKISMRNYLLALPLFAALTLIGPAGAAEKTKDHDHGHTHAKKEAGPNGGRLLTALEPHAEFLVLPDRRVQITFLDAQDKPVAPGNQIVVVTAGERSAPTKLTFALDGAVLRSNGPLPAGNDFPTVVQIKVNPAGRFVTEKFNLNLSVCPDCKHAEYACICAEH